MRRALIDVIEKAEPKRCFAGLSEDCKDTPVRAHFIQRALLRTISNASGFVHPLYNLSVKNWGHADPDLHERLWFHSEIHTKAAASRRFVCRMHESMFQEMERPKPDWENPRHQTLLAFRSLLINSYVKEWLADACALMGEEQLSEKHLEQLGYSVALEASLRRALVSANYASIRHLVVYLDVNPTLAATGVIVYPPLGTVLSDTITKVTKPISSYPLVVNVLPDEHRQVLLLSHTGEGLPSVRYLLSKLQHTGTSISTGQLSKILLEEFEFIHVSPSAWNSFGKAKQDAIVQHYVLSMGSTEREFDTPSNLLDLFSEP